MEIRVHIASLVIHFCFSLCNYLFLVISSWCKCLFTGQLSINKSYFHSKACSLFLFYCFVRKTSEFFMIVAFKNLIGLTQHDQKHLNLLTIFTWPIWQTKQLCYSMCTLEYFVLQELLFTRRYTTCLFVFPAKSPWLLIDEISWQRIMVPQELLLKQCL